MRTTKTVSISLPPAQFKKAERMARKQNRTISELFREGLRRLEMEEKRNVGAELLEALRLVQEDSRRAGLNRMTEREIEAEITAARRARRKVVAVK